MVALGIYAVYFALSKIIVFVKIKKTGIKTVGKVEKIIDPEFSILSGTAYVPVFTFMVDGDEITGIARNSVRSSPSFYKEGKTYTVYYK